MKTFLIAAMLASAGAPALAQPAAPRPMPVVTRAELQARIEQRFAALDANHDGVVTRQELDARRRTFGDEGRDRAFARLDTDRNGQISRQEFAAGPSLARPGEMRRGPGPRPMMMARRAALAERWLDRLDANHDGRLTLAEASALPLSRFDRLDADRDGKVTPAERRAFREGLRARRG